MQIFKRLYKGCLNILKPKLKGLIMNHYQLTFSTIHSGNFRFKTDIRADNQEHAEEILQRLEGGKAVNVHCWFVGKVIENGCQNWYKGA